VATQAEEPPEPSDSDGEVEVQRMPDAETGDQPVPAQDEAQPADEADELSQNSHADAPVDQEELQPQLQMTTASQPATGATGTDGEPLTLDDAKQQPADASAADVTISGEPSHDQPLDAHSADASFPAPEAIEPDASSAETAGAGLESGTPDCARPSQGTIEAPTASEGISVADDVADLQAASVIETARQKEQRAPEEGQAESELPQFESDQPSDQPEEVEQSSKTEAPGSTADARGSTGGSSGGQDTGTTAQDDAIVSTTHRPFDDVAAAEGEGGSGDGISTDLMPSRLNVDESATERAPAALAEEDTTASPDANAHPGVATPDIDAVYTAAQAAPSTATAAEARESVAAAGTEAAENDAELVESAVGSASGDTPWTEVQGQ
jgi:hypothetical protein